MGNARDAIALSHHRWAARGKQHASSWRDDLHGWTLWGLDEVQLANRLIGRDVRAKIDQGFVQTRLGSKAIVLPIE